MIAVASELGAVVAIAVMCVLSGSPIQSSGVDLPCLVALLPIAPLMTEKSLLWSIHLALAVVWMCQMPVVGELSLCFVLAVVFLLYLFHDLSLGAVWRITLSIFLGGLVGSLGELVWR